ncbi:MAG: hypothetical protein WBA39_23110 [Rivularia sp. (in: cyanobacteria)]
MLIKELALITFISVYLFFCAAICLFVDLFIGLIAFSKIALDPTLTTAGLSIQELLLLITKLIFFGFLFWKTAMGLLNKQNWARLISIFMSGYSFFGYILDLMFGNENSFFFFNLLLTGIFLYGMTLNRSVNDYFR